MPSAMPMSAQDNPWSRTSRRRSRSPASIFVADVDGIRSSSSSPHIKAHFGSDGGSAGTAWPTCRRCRCLPGDERGNPTWGRTPTSRTTPSDAAPQSATPAPSNHRTQTAYAGTLPGHSAGRPCATAMSRHVGAVVHGAGEVAAVPGRLAMALRPTTQRMARQ